LALAYRRERKLPVVVGRLFNVVGPRQTGAYGMVLPRFVDAALAGRPLVVHDDGRQQRCFAHVSDVVRMILALMASPAAVGGVFNVGDDRPVSILDLARRVIAIVNPSLQVELISYAEAYGADFEDCRCRVPDLSKMRKLTGLECRHGLDDIIREVTAWKRQLLN
jgi:UDP-glucose 4-epimerase